jgi:hypothetical protein
VLLKKFHDKNQELVNRANEANSKPRDIYLTNVAIVAQHRVDVAKQDGMNAKKLEKLCNRGTLAELVRQAERELERVSEYANRETGNTQ